MFMEFVETILNIRKARQISIVFWVIVGVVLGCTSEENLFFVYSLKRLVESSMKSCENFLKYACG